MAEKSGMKNEALRDLPKVNDVLQHQAMKRWRGSPLATPAVRAELEEHRGRIRRDGGKAPSLALVAKGTAARLASETAPRLQSVINGTGIIIHTNLGRAPLGRKQLEAITHAASEYSTLEYELKDGCRGSRHTLVTHLLTALTGAEDALVVNNNAAALMLSLAAIAGKREVIVSRGQLVEIGGSFRIPDICRAAGVKLVEVGTTNRTRIEDFRDAAGKKTALLLRVHRSNFKVEGFTEDVTLDELVRLGEEIDVPVVDDLGSGALIDVSRRSALQREPLAGDSTAAGADVVTFSGDKLLGGPQAGIAIGKSKAIAKMRKHPLMRALRPDKLTFAALDATLRAYLTPDDLAKELPIWKMIEADSGSLQKWGGPLTKSLIDDAKRAGLQLALEESEATTGGGSLPGQSLPSLALTFRGDGGSLTTLQQQLRWGNPPVIGYLQEGALRLDLRTMMLADRAEVRRSVSEALARSKP